MKPVSLTSEQFAQYLNLVDSVLGSGSGGTSLREDFPLVLSPENRDWVLGIVEDGQVVAGLACLIRQFKTSCGTVPVAGIGHVVTRTDFQGRGCSRTLQEVLLEKLRKANVPLAVLWTDKPRAFAGRGFSPAGWEFHVDLQGADLTAECPAGFSFRPFVPGDTESVAGLYNRHPYRTLRHPDDSGRLYTIPGTRGLVAAGQDGVPAAAVFCGKGDDFKDFVTEWSGPLGLVVPLLHEVRKRGWVRFVLAPSGGENLAQALAQRGAAVTAGSSGHWLVLQPDKLSSYLQGAGQGAPASVEDPAAVLGGVDGQGVVVPGALTLAVWGFDSV